MPAAFRRAGLRAGAAGAAGREFAAPVLMLVTCAWLFHYTGALAWQGWRSGNTAGLSLPFHETDQLTAHIPGDLDQGRKLIAAIRALDGSAWVMHANYYAWLAGRPTEIGIDNVRDLTIGAQPISPYALRILGALDPS